MSLKFSSACSPDNTARYSNNAPDVFSRGSLMFTYELLRKHNPELALTIRNIVHGTPLDKSDQDIDSQNTDHFTVDISTLQVRAIVEGLVAQDIPSPSPENMGKVIMAKALIDEWAKLARKMLQERPEEQGS
ncbi:hypothetical protein WH96_05670 [Kiloniella spongiae]|uniref:Uncharacterized protein n=1 Tax=Kiloniella spongiae TaxID=1489064 RepID=A0A0H2MYG5_9PROT|nr:hypothetical protein [Kiloniella spongiae]KLN61780.1 hypothetical protein WH96_05670 [Kiloniella spongiae]